MPYEPSPREARHVWKYRSQKVGRGAACCPLAAMSRADGSQVMAQARAECSGQH